MDNTEYAPRMLVYNDETGLVIVQRHAMRGDLPTELNPEKIGFIYVDDETTPAIRVNPITKEVEWEPADNTLNIEDLAANLIQQGITPEMLTQIQESMRSAETVKQPGELTD